MEDKKTKLQNLKDELFGTDDNTNKDILIEEIKEYENNPFKKYSDEKLQELAESIKISGLIHPITIILKDNEYIVINGHNRLKALKILGYEKLENDMYKLEKDLTEEEINLIVVNTNLNQRQNLFYSEKAFAYKMQLNAIKNQGRRNDLTSTQVVSNIRSNEIVGNKNNESRENIRRYIRLTYLLTELLDMLDDEKIKFTVAVELSYLKGEEQQILLEKFIKNGTQVSLDKAIELKKYSNDDKLTYEIMELIFKKEDKKAKNINIEIDKIKKYFPSNYSNKDMKEIIITLLEEYSSGDVNG